MGKNKKELRLLRFLVDEFFDGDAVSFTIDGKRFVSVDWLENFVTENKLVYKQTIDVELLLSAIRKKTENVLEEKTFPKEESSKGLDVV